MIAGPGHGGSRYRVKTKLTIEGRHVGHVQYRRLCFWMNIKNGDVVGNTAVEALHKGGIQIEEHKGYLAARDKRMVTYL